MFQTNLIEQKNGGYRHSYRGYTLPYLKKRYKDVPEKTRDTIQYHIESGRLYRQLEGLYNYISQETASSARKFLRDYPHQKKWYNFYCKVFSKHKTSGTNSYYSNIRHLLKKENYPEVTGQKRIDLSKKINPAGGWSRTPLAEYLDRTHAFIYHLDMDERRLFFKKNPNLRSAIRVYAISDGKGIMKT